MKPSPTPESQLNAFIAEYSPEIAAQAHAVLARVRKLVPGAIQLVYDNYNGLVVGFGPSERVSDAIFSIALYIDQRGPRTRRASYQSKGQRPARNQVDLRKTASAPAIEIAFRLRLSLSSSSSLLRPDNRNKLCFGKPAFLFCTHNYDRTRRLSV